MPKREVVTEELFLDWLEHPVTQAVKRVQARKREELRTQWENGELVDMTEFKTAVESAHAMGQARAAKWLLELDLETLKGELADED